MISISKKAQYGLLALIELGVYFQSRRLQTKVIAQTHQMPHKFLESVLKQLNKAGIINSFRGTNGGYELAKDPKDIHVLDMMIALEEFNDFDSMKNEPGVDVFWVQSIENIKKQFDVSLQTLLNKHQRDLKRLTYSI